MHECENFNHQRRKAIFSIKSMQDKTRDIWLWELQPSIEKWPFHNLIVMARDCECENFNHQRRKLSPFLAKKKYSHSGTKNDFFSRTRNWWKSEFSNLKDFSEKKLYEYKGKGVVMVIYAKKME